MERELISPINTLKILKRYGAKEKAITLIPIILILIGVLSFIFAIDIYFEDNIITDQLTWISPAFLAITMILIIFSFFWSLNDIIRVFKKIDKKTWIILLIIFIAGLYLRTAVAPQTHRIYWDEDLDLNIGQAIAKEGKALRPAYGSLDPYSEGVFTREPNGCPFLFSFVFLFGGGESEAFALTAVISSLTIILVFLVSYLLFKNKKISIFSTLIFMLIPITIRWAPTASSDTICMFFSGLTIFAFLLYIKQSNSKTLLFSFATLAYSAQIRPEAILLIIPAVIAVFLFKKDIFKIIQKKYFILLLIVFLILVLPHLIHLNLYKEDDWDAEQFGFETGRFSSQYVQGNLQDNALFFFENTRFPVVFTLLSLIGLAYKKMWKTKFFLVLWFFVFFGVFLLFYAGTFNFLSDVRYSLTLYVPLAILGGCGAFLTAEILKKMFKKSFIALVIITFVIFLSFLPFLGFVASYGDGYNTELRAIHDFLFNNLDTIEEDSIVFTTLLAPILVNGKTALSLGYTADLDFMNNLLKESDHIYFFQENNGSEFSPKDLFEFIHHNYKLTVYNSSSYGDEIFTFYKVDGWK